VKRLARVEFPLPVVLTLITGVFMCSKIEHVFSCASYVVGYPIAQHELPDHESVIRIAILTQHPLLANVEDVKPERPDAATFLSKYIERQIGRFGATVFLKRGKAVRTESPIDSLRRRAPHMRILCVDDKPPRRARSA